MSIFKILKSNQGLSIVEVLMAVGVLGIGALALVNLTQNTAKDTRSVDLNAVKAQYYNSFKEFINSKAGCDELKKGTFNRGYSNIVIDSSKLPKIVREKYFEIKSIQGKRMLNDSLVDPSTANTSIEVRLTLEVFKNSKRNTTSLSGTGGSGGSSGAGAGSGAGSGIASLSGQEIYYFIIPALVDGSGKVLKCETERTKDLACRAIDGELNPLTDKCEVKESCKLRGSYVVATGYASDHQKVNPVTNALNCPSGPNVQTIQTGFMPFRIEQPASKKSPTPFETGSVTFYSCLECPPGTSTTGGGGFTGSGGGGGGGGGLGSGSGAGSI